MMIKVKTIGLVFVGAAVAFVATIGSQWLLYGEAQRAYQAKLDSTIVAAYPKMARYLSLYYDCMKGGPSNAHILPVKGCATVVGEAADEHDRDVVAYMLFMREIGPMNIVIPGIGAAVWPWGIEAPRLGWPARLFTATAK